MIRSTPPSEREGQTVRHPVPGSSDYLVITIDKRIWNPITQRWLVCRTWPRMSFLDRDGRQRNVSVSKTWRSAFSKEIDSIPNEDKCDLSQFGYPGYWIVRDGRVWSCRWLRWVPHSRCVDKHFGVNLNQRPVAVHRLLALAFVPNPAGYRYACLKDPNQKSNLSLSNIEWREASHPKGIYVPRRYSLTELDRARNLLRAGMTPVAVARRTGISRPHVHNLKRQLKSPVTGQLL